MSASWLMAGASLLFALMGACVKWASELYSAGELVLYRSLIGLLAMAAVMRWRGIRWRSAVPGMHLWRSLTGTVSLCMWFYAIGGLPLATAMTLNAMSSVWIALFLLGAALLFKPGAAHRPDARLIFAVLAGFGGVALLLRPTLAQDQLMHGLIGLASGMIAALAYLQVSALGRIGEPGERVVLYFAASGVAVGGMLALAMGGFQAHTAAGLGLLLAIGLLATMAQWMLTRAYGSGSTLGVAALQYLGIAFSFLLGLLLFGDPLTSTSVLGMVLIVGAGIAANLLRPRSPGPSPDPPGSNQTSETLKQP